MNYYFYNWDDLWDLFFLFLREKERVVKKSKTTTTSTTTPTSEKEQIQTKCKMGDEGGKSIAPFCEYMYFFDYLCFFGCLCKRDGHPKEKEREKKKKNELDQYDFFMSNLLRPHGIHSCILSS